MTFPISIPTTPAPKALRITRRSAVGVSQSPMTGQQQVYAWPGKWWEIDAQFPPMTAAQAKDWIAFFVSLNGQEGTFTWTLPDTGWSGSGVTPPTTWRLVSNATTWDVGEAMQYGFSMSCREVL